MADVRALRLLGFSLSAATAVVLVAAAVTVSEASKAEASKVQSPAAAITVAAD
jgi:hypothetical protein